MAVDTLIPTGALPEPAIDALLNRMKKMLTNLNKSEYIHSNTLQAQTGTDEVPMPAYTDHEAATYNVSFWLVLFLLDDLLQFILIPLIHCICTSDKCKQCIKLIHIMSVMHSYCVGGGEGREEGKDDNCIML